MKKLILGLMLAFTGMVKAAEVGDTFEIKGLAYDATYDFSTGAQWANRIGAIVTYTSQTFTANTFTDGRTSSGTATIISTSGLAGQYITVGAYKFCAGSLGADCAKADTTYVFAVGTNVNATATKLAAAILASSTTTGLTATAASAAVNIVGTKCDGINPPMTTSGAKITIGGNAMGAGVAATVSTNDKITILAHGFQTGAQLLLSGATPPTGLTAGTTYFAEKVDDNNIELASSLINAIGGTAVDITAVAVGATAHTTTLTPLTIAGTPSFKWQASNDTANWIDMVVSSTTMLSYTAGGTSSMWDFSWYPYKWLRLKVIGPTAGGIYLKSTLSVKQ